MGENSRFVIYIYINYAKGVEFSSRKCVSMRKRDFV